MGEEESNLVKHWLKNIILAVLLIAVFAAAVAVGTVADVQEMRVEELLQKVERLEAECAELRLKVEVNDEIVNRWLEVGSWSG
jgi:3'-phosphoadenosine 5'-phosphosulfate sulfotransferase